MLFNIFINDLFFHVKKAKLKAYADDHQVYYSTSIRKLWMHAYLMMLAWPISGTIKMGC